MDRHDPFVLAAQQEYGIAASDELHHWFMQEASEPLRTRFGRWQAGIQAKQLSPRDVDKEARRFFLTVFAGRTDQIDKDFLEWVKRL